ncbi:MAG: DUF5615 family PIN-like protein [Candidatus Nanohaloarchaea archaeon]|nr:DUF5615 family PIN-like protein [Candidatus Nanohaloarchaea archaeon]
MFPLVADEDVENAIVEKLRDSGVEIFSIDEEMKGALDPEVLGTAKELDRPILTFDEEFARTYQDGHDFLYVTSYPGDDKVVESVLEVVENLERDQVEGLVYISPG